MSAVVLVSGVASGAVVAQSTGLQGAAGPQAAPVVHRASASIVVPETSGFVYVGLSALASNVTVTVPAASSLGMQITVKIEDTSLANFHVTFDGNGASVIGPDASGATFVITKEAFGTGAVSGPSVTFMWNGVDWMVI